MLAGGDCIDDADELRAGRTGQVLGCVVKAPSTLGTFLRSFRWGHARQLDRVTRELLARAWGAGAAPGDGELTIDLDSTICETYGLGKEGARRHGYTGQRDYHPLLAVAAGTGDVLMARLREGRANTARGPAHFLRETVGRVRSAGPPDNSPYAPTAASTPAPWSPSAARWMCAFHHARLRNLIEDIPEGDWTAIPYWMDGAADVAETTYVPFESKPDAAPVRLIVRRVKPRPIPNWHYSPTTAITPSSPTGRATPWNWKLTIATTPRSRTPSETSSTAWASSISPRDAFLPTPLGWRSR